MRHGWLAGLVLVACSQPDAPSDPGVRVYALANTDSAGVEAKFIKAGSIRLNENGTFSERMERHVNFRDSYRVYTGTYTFAGSALELVYSDTRPSIADTVTVHGDTALRRSDCSRLAYDSYCPPLMLYRRER